MKKIIVISIILNLPNMMQASIVDACKEYVRKLVTNHVKNGQAFPITRKAQVPAIVAYKMLQREHKKPIE